MIEEMICSIFFHPINLSLEEWILPLHYPPSSDRINKIPTLFIIALDDISYLFQKGNWVVEFEKIRED